MLNNPLFSSLPVAASIFTEIQLKGKESSVDETSFLEKQFWLYFYGSVVALAGHLGNDAGYLPHNFIEDIAGKRIRIWMEDPPPLYCYCCNPGNDESIIRLPECQLGAFHATYPISVHPYESLNNL